MPSWAPHAAEARSGCYARGRGWRSSEGMRRHPRVRITHINPLELLCDPRRLAVEVPGAEDAGREEDRDRREQMGQATGGARCPRRAGIDHPFPRLLEERRE